MWFSPNTNSIALIEKWEKSVGTGGAFGALMTDPSKGFDCLSHELLTAKQDAYGFVQYLDHYSSIFLYVIGFCFVEDYGIANYADDSTPYSAKTNQK